MCQAHKLLFGNNTQQEQVDEKDCVKSLSGRENRAELFLKKNRGKYVIYG